MYPSSIRDLIECLKDLPGIGEKSAERLAYAIVGFDKEKLDNFANSLNNIKNNIKRCPVCNCITDMEVCYICNDKNRVSDTIFVVEKSKDIVLFEKMGTYNGKYHVLDGLISPIDGISPNDINIPSLIKRCKNSDDQIELVIALKPTIEGETTTQYIKKVLEDKTSVKVSRLSYGLPVGTELDYLDSLTLERAFEDRKNIA